MSSNPETEWPAEQRGRRRLSSVGRRIIALEVGQIARFARAPHPGVRATASWLGTREGRRYETRVELDTRAIRVKRVA